MNRTTKILLGLGGAIVFCLCGVGLAAVSLRMLGERVISGIKSDPADIASIGDQIADYTVPEGYTERFGMDFVLYKAVMIAPQEENGLGVMFMLTEFSSNQTLDRKQMEEQVRRSMDNRTGARGLTMRVVATKTITIRGQESLATISEAESEGFAFRQEMAFFDGKQGTTMLMIQGVISDWDQALVDEFIASIR